MHPKAVGKWATRWELSTDEIDQFLDWFALRVATARVKRDQSGEGETHGSAGGLPPNKKGSEYVHAKREALLLQQRQLKYLRQEIDILEIRRDNPLDLIRLRAEADVMEERLERLRQMAPLSPEESHEQ